MACDLKFVVFFDVAWTSQALEQTVVVGDLKCPDTHVTSLKWKKFTTSRILYLEHSHHVLSQISHNESSGHLPRTPLHVWLLLEHTLIGVFFSFSEYPGNNWLPILQSCVKKCAMLELTLVRFHDQVITWKHLYVTDYHCHLQISQFDEHFSCNSMQTFCSDPHIWFENLTCAKIKSENFCPGVYITMIPQMYLWNLRYIHVRNCYGNFPICLCDQGRMLLTQATSDYCMDKQLLTHALTSSI